MAQHYFTVTWDQLHRDAKALAWRLHVLGPWAGIVAITRGGLIPAAIIARELECRLIESVCVITYDEEKRGEPQVTKPPLAAGDGTGWLIIDDLVDSGTTAAATTPCGSSSARITSAEQLQASILKAAAGEQAVSHVGIGAIALGGWPPSLAESQSQA